MTTRNLHPTDNKPRASSIISALSFSLPILFSALGLSLATGCSDDKSQEEENAELVEEFMTEVVFARNLDLGEQYLAADYTEHDFLVEDGIEAWRNAIEATPPATSTIRRLIAEGDMVFVHTQSVLPDGAGEIALSDIFRVEDGLLVEHWNSIQLVPDDQVPADNSMFDGPEPDLNAFDDAGVEANKANAIRAFDLFFNQRDFAAAEALHAADFIQHNPGTDNGWNAFQTRLTGFFAASPDMHWNPKRVLGAGDFVVIHGQYTFSALNCGDDDAEGSFNAMDIFRFDPDTGLIAEHWDLISIVPDQIVGRSPFDGAGLLSAAGTPCRQLSPSEQDADLVLTFNDRLFDDGRLDAIDQFLHPEYINHNPGSPNGRQAFKDSVGPFLEGGGITNLDTVRFISQDGYVFVHNDVTLGDGTRNVAGDIYRVVDGLITEHWDVTQAVPSPADSVPNDNTMVGGPGIDLSAFDAAGVEANKAKAINGFDLFFNQRDFASAEALHDADMIQHNPGTDHGWNAFQTRLEAFFANSPAMHWTPKRVLGSGDFVVVHGHYTFAAETCGDDGEVGSLAAIDIFRIDPATGLIAEHWDVLQPVIDPSEQTPVGQSMFDGPGLYDGPQTPCS